MKYQLYSTLIGSLLFFSACEDKLDEKHENPDAFGSTEIEYLFAQGAKKTLENDYGDCYNYTFRLLGIYTQTTARGTGQDRTNTYLIQNDKDRWQNYYETRMNTLTEIDKMYEALDEAGKNAYRPYIETAKVLKAYNTAIATDFFGDMPYSEAFTARNTLYGKEVILKPKYDTQKEIYYAILEELKSAAAYLKTAALDKSIDEQSAMTRQDVVYQGDLQKWYKFANSLILRYAMRISNVDEAKTKEVLKAFSIADFITDNQDNAYIVDQTDVSYENGIWRALKESHSKNQGYYCYAPELMVELMNQASDPRLRLLFQPGTDDDGKVIAETNDIVGYPSSADAAIELLSELSAAEIMKKYAVYSSVTFRNNQNLPVGIGITAAEVYFLLAEAQQRNLISLGDAKTFYDNGIIASVQNYHTYYANSSDTGNKVAAITEMDVATDVLQTWLDNSTMKFDPTKALEQIATQKWIHTGILQTYETWAEYRRTDLPVLKDDKEKGTLLNKENAPKRFLYPAGEASMNTDNYNSVSAQNYPEKNLWWDVN